jgi:hypothetical protein
MVRDVEPSFLPINVGVNKLVRQILLRGVFSQLDAGSSDYPWVGGTWLLLTVKIRQPSYEFTFGVGMSFIPYPLVLTPVV